ncbi:MAG: hypothetical protein JXB17_13690, partial [Bacteroidales bacterium]|nr:hypothetical protein [Bacteroidales bacterium]
MANIFAVKYYNRHSEWYRVLKLLPWAFIGIIIALIGMAGIIMMIWRDIKDEKTKSYLNLNHYNKDCMNT